MKDTSLLFILKLFFIYGIKAVETPPSPLRIRYNNVNIAPVTRELIKKFTRHSVAFLSIQDPEAPQSEIISSARLKENPTDTERSTQESIKEQTRLVKALRTYTKNLPRHSHLLSSSS